MESVSNSKTMLEIFRVGEGFRGQGQKGWRELESIGGFLGFLERVEEKYWIEEQLYRILERDVEGEACQQHKHDKGDR